jgi:DNA topoisomerase-1
MSKYTLVITEKPDAAKRIAQALDKEQKPEKRQLNHTPYYIAKHDQKIVIVPAIGHLYTVTAETKDRSNYPVFTFKWAPRYVAERNAKQTRKWIETITELAQDADKFIDACDYDTEGSIIGYNILKHACHNKETAAKRMKYSTLTKEELQKAYLTLLPHLDFAFIEAGLTRHEIDWLYGINLTRALTTAVKNHSGQYATLSTGRVQGPTLKFIAQREKSIKTFVPTPYWTIKAQIEINGQIYEAQYKKPKIETKKETDTILEATKEKNGQIQKIGTKKYVQPPLTPFDLGSLQHESYRLFSHTPKHTLDIAQHLYLNALISYPRTSSQKLPPSINYAAILRNLNRLSEYRKLTDELLAKPRLTPNEGKKEDPAHPAIHPTGNLPERELNSSERKLLDLIIRRYMAIFGEPAARQTFKATINVNEHHFHLCGTQTLKEGWFRFYRPYITTREDILPKIEEGQEIKIKTIICEEKFTTPPSRYTPSSLLRKMEKAEIGTKATRANIIQTLYNRKYVTDERIVITSLGLEVLEILDRFCPTIVSTELTRELEEKMDLIQTNKEKRENVLEEAINILEPVTARLKEKEETIGRQLAIPIRQAKTEERTVGVCPNCKTGKLTILHSRKTGKRFVGCTNYFKNLCRTAYPIPQKGTIRPLKRNCPECGLPTVLVRTSGRRPWKLCINPQCPLKNKGGKRIEMQNMR